MKNTRMKELGIVMILLLISVTGAGARQKYPPLDNWLKDNIAEMGGRAVLLVYKDGKMVYSNTVNKLNMRQKMATRIIAKRMGKPADLADFTAETKLQVASCSKWLSAALVMTFIDEGRLKLTDTLGRFLPVLSQHGKGNITISQCLSHTTGIKAPPLKEALQDMKTISTMDEAVAEISELPMEGVPGEVFHYSNVGLQLTGAVIEKLGGKGFADLFAERIAGPLDMLRTDFGGSKVALPAGGASSTADDYLKFLVMVMNKGKYNGKQILSEKSIEEMQVNRLTADVKITYSPSEAAGTGYGYGEWVMEDAISSPGLFGSYPLVDKAHGYAAVLMTFYMKSGGKQQRYAELKRILDEFALAH